MALRVPVLVCGEPWRADDGAAREAVRLLDEHVLRLADVRLVGQLDPNHLLDARPERPCIVVDTVIGVLPGQIVVRPLTGLGGPAGPGLRSTHALPPAETIALAEALGADMRGSWLVGIGGADFTLGAPLSADVEAGLPRLSRTLGRTILELARLDRMDLLPAPGPALVSATRAHPRKESQP